MEGFIMQNTLTWLVGIVGHLMYGNMWSTNRRTGSSTDCVAMNDLLPAGGFCLLGLSQPVYIILYILRIFIYML